MAVSVALLAVLARSIDPREIGPLFTRAVPEWAFLLGFATVAGRLLMAFKWRGLLRARGVVVPYGQALRIYFVGTFLGGFTPGDVGGDLYRGTALARHGDGRVVGSTIILERVLGLAVISWAATVLLPVGIHRYDVGTGSMAWAALGITLSVALGLYVSFQPAWIRAAGRLVPGIKKTKVARVVWQFYGAYVDAHRYPAALLIFVGLTALQQLLVVSFTWLAARTLALDVPFFYALCFVPAMTLILRLPISIQRLGIQEGLYALFLTGIGLSPESGVALSLVLRVAGIVCISLPASVLMWIGGRRPERTVSRV